MILTYRLTQAGMGLVLLGLVRLAALGAPCSDPERPTRPGRRTQPLAS